MVEFKKMLLISAACSMIMSALVAAMLFDADTVAQIYNDSIAEFFVAISGGELDGKDYVDLLKVSKDYDLSKFDSTCYTTASGKFKLICAADEMSISCIADLTGTEKNLPIDIMAFGFLLNDYVDLELTNWINTGTYEKSVYDGEDFIAVCANVPGQEMVVQFIKK